MLPSCAQETLLYLRILRVRRSLNSVQSQQDQMLLIISNTFLFLVLGFHAIGIDCRDKDSPEIVCGGVVPDSQILQIWILAFRFLEIRQLAVEGDAGSRFKKTAFASGLSLVHPGGLTVCRQNLRVGHHSASV